MNDKELKDNFPTIWDNTMRCMLAQCPRKLYYFLRRFDYAPSEMPSYFLWGQAWHHATLVWHSSPPTEPGTEAHRLRIKLMQEAAEEYWLTKGGQDKQPNDTLENLKNKLFNYTQEYPSEDWTIIPRGGEVGWVWPLNSTYELGGSLDSYITWEPYGNLVLEKKSTGGYLTSNYLNQYWFSSQIKGYVWYLSQLSPKVYGALVDCATKVPKRPTSKWTTAEFQRQLIKVAPWELEQFQEDFLLDLKLFESYWESWTFPQKGFLHPAICAGGAGYSKCLFSPICRSGIRPEDVDPRRFPGIVELTTKWEPWLRTEEQE